MDAGRNVGKLENYRNVVSTDQVKNSYIEMSEKLENWKTRMFERMDEDKIKVVKNQGIQILVYLKVTHRG